MFVEYELSVNFSTNKSHLVGGALLRINLVRAELDFGMCPAARSYFVHQSIGKSSGMINPTKVFMTRANSSHSSHCELLHSPYSVGAWPSYCVS